MTPVVLILILIGVVLMGWSYFKNITVVRCEPEGCVSPPFYYFRSFWIGLAIAVLGVVLKVWGAA